MRGEPVDRVPFTPNLNGYNIRTMPERYQTMQRWDILKELEIDLLVRFRTGARVRPPFMLMPPPEGPISLAGTAARQWDKSMPVTDKIRITNEIQQNDVQRIIVDTPKGQLYCDWKYTPSSPDMAFPIKPLLTTVEDFDIYHYILDHTVVEAAYEEIEEALDAVGDEGTCEANGGPTPMQELIEILMGIEIFYKMIVEHTRETEELMNHMLEVRKEEYRLLAQSPAPIIVSGENTSTTIASPAYMAKYEFTSLDELSDILHREGKIHMVHMCGKLHHALDVLTSAKFDGSQDVAPAPTGDFDFVIDRERYLAAGKSVCGGIDCTAFHMLTPDELGDYVAKRLQEVAPGRGFLLGAGDTVPPGTSAKQLKAVVQAVKQYGKYPINNTDKRNH